MRLGVTIVNLCWTNRLLVLAKLFRNTGKTGTIGVGVGSLPASGDSDSDSERGWKTIIKSGIHHVCGPVAHQDRATDS